MAHQYIFQMHRLSKAYPPDKTVLKDVTLAFLPGAKIGVLGYNGAGKSTVLRIMAGRETDFRGDAMLAPGATVGLLEQEPPLDEGKDVRGNVEDGVAATRALLDRFNELAANYSDETADEFARLQAQIDAADAWNLDTNVEYAMDALRLPPADAEVERLSGGERRRVALCRLLLSAPDLLLLDEPTNHLDAESVAWLERHLAEYAGHRRGRDPRSLLPRQRRRLDPRARPLARDPLRGQLLELARAEAGPDGPGGAHREGAPEDDRRRAGVGAPEPQGPPDQAEGAPDELRGARRPGAQRQARRGPDPHPGRPAAGRRGRAGRGPAQGLRRHAAHRRPELLAAARRDRRRDRPQRRGQDDAVPDDHRPGAARRGGAARRRDGRAGLRRPVARRARSRPRRCGRRSPAARTSSRSATAG